MSITQALFNILIAIHTVLSLKPASDQKVVLDSHHHFSDNVYCNFQLGSKSNRLHIGTFYIGAFNWKKGVVWKSARQISQSKNMYSQLVLVPKFPSRINLNHLQVVLVGFLERVLFDVKLRETRVNCTTKLLLQNNMSNYLHQVCFHNYDNYGRLYWPNLGHQTAWHSIQTDHCNALRKLENKHLTAGTMRY